MRARCSTLSASTKPNMTPSSKAFSCLSRPARTETYAGLLILLLGITVLVFARCPNRVPKFATRAYGSPPRTGKGALPDSVSYGSAPSDGRLYQGWWVGHFVQQKSLRHTSAVETKWVSHHAGRRHDGFATNKIATSMAVLISGKHRVEFERSYVVLENPGDYVIWGPGVAHSWTALDDSTMLCVRWPSISGDQDGKVGGTNSSMYNVERHYIKHNERVAPAHEGNRDVDSSSLVGTTNSAMVASAIKETDAPFLGSNL